MKISNPCLIALVSNLAFLSCACSLAKAAEPPPPSQQTILAPQGLEQKEQNQLEQQYRFQYRNKQSLLSPYTPPAGGGGATSAAGEETQAINEKEKLYRYFGIATSLYESGKTEEAIEILRYIVLKNPNDEYVKNYLKKLSEEKQKKKFSWEKNNAEEARALKNKQIKDLLEDGIGYYKQRDFDTALLKFADILALDPDNKIAKEYLDMLKKYYLQEVKAEDASEEWESSKSAKEDLGQGKRFFTEKKNRKEQGRLQDTDLGASSLKPEEKAPANQIQPLNQNIFDYAQASGYKEIFDYYLNKADTSASKGNMEEAYKACKMIFLVLPNLPEKAKLDILARVVAIAKEEKKLAAASPGLKKQSKKFLDKEEGGLENKAGTSDSLLDNAEFQGIILEKKAGNLIDETELDSRIEDIIQQKKDEERKARSFTIGPGDIVQVSVRDHPELSGQAVIRVNGDLVLPLTNDIVPAQNETLSELNEAIAKAYKRYVKEPQVDTTIVEYKSKMFYVVDQTGATPYPISRANFTLRDALFISDWGSNRALGRILVIKPSKVNPIIKTVNAFDLIYKGRLINNIPIENGDVIYVPLTIVGRATEVITDVAAPMLTLNGGLTSTDNAIQALRKIKGQSLGKITSNRTGGS